MLLRVERGRLARLEFPGVNDAQSATLQSRLVGGPAQCLGSGRRFVDADEDRRGITAEKISICEY
jgi:hypothetical protein